MAYEGLVIAIFGAWMSAGLSTVTSTIGIRLASQSAGGRTSEAKKFGKVLILQLLPGTKCVYGLLAAILVMLKVGLAGAPALMSSGAGLALLFACMPMVVCNAPSALWQGKLAARCARLVTMRSGAFSKAMIFLMVVELPAVLSLLITVMLVIKIPV